MGIEEVRRIRVSCDGKSCNAEIKATHYNRRKLTDRARGRGWLISQKHNLAYCPKCRDNIMLKGRSRKAKEPVEQSGFDIKTINDEGQATIIFPE